MNTPAKYLGAAMLLAAFAAPAALADDHYSNPQESILKAAATSPAALQKELDSGIDINATDDDRDTALMDAAEEGNLTAVKNLIAAGADVNLQNEDAKSALMMAAGEGHTEVVKTLLAAGADPAAVDKDGETAHQKAVDDGHDATAEVLRNAISK
ncbi:MAG: ankyrin repeat domain-containing protein [Akkermansia sp.]|nr:ankyrin repeat domain-containing protein [Akkermansia sp.]